MTWLYYLLEANLYLAIFYGFYLVFLRSETFYGLNRGYLIVSSLFSFVIPFLKIGDLNRLVDQSENIDLIYIDPNLGNAQENLSWMSLEEVFIVVYLLIATYFIFKLGISVYKIVSLAIGAKEGRLGRIRYLELTNDAPAFSFFNLLFINKLGSNINTILKHEMVHIQQKHSLDILFFELLKIINWFSPVVWLIQRDIKLLHEYIADDITTRADVEKHKYAMFLIQNSFGVTPADITSQIFNQSILKKRIMMLNKKRSAGRARLRFLLALPLVGGMLFASTVAFSKEYALIDMYPEKSREVVSQDTSLRPIPKPILQTVRYFDLDYKVDQKTKVITRFDDRLVVINGKIPESGSIFRVQGYDRIVKLNATEAKKKYGEKGAAGALEFTGKNIQTLGLPAGAKYPPPIIVKDAPLPPAKSKSKSKTKIPEPKVEQVKFPPPTVKRD